MRNLLILLIVILVQFGCTSKKELVEGKIVFNSLGFLTDGAKTATILEPEATEFDIINAETLKKEYSGKSVETEVQKDINQKGFIAEFSEFSKPGTYFIETNSGHKSLNFTIGKKMYNDAFYASMRAFYLWRCGTAVEGNYNGVTFKQNPCHMEDGYLDYTEFGAKQKDGSGGWHDAGDHGKYVTNAGLTMGMMFMAWDNFSDKLKDFKLDLPNTADNYPDFLKELKWETDWLLKMQYPDSSGKVFHKLTRTNFSGFIMPHDDLEKRYFTEWGSTATAAFTGIMAMAARYYKPYDTAYAAICLKAAKRSYNFLAQNPEYKKWEQEEFHTGTYNTNDINTRIWAAAELWETTGNGAYLKDFEAKIEEASVLVDYIWDWGNMKNLGVFTYLTSEKEGKNADLYNKIATQAIAIADSIVTSTKTDLYGRPSAKYEWGCNGTVARLSSNLYVAYSLTDDEKYKQAAQEITAHLFGRNYYNRSYVTGLGINPPIKPHDRRSAADSITEPWPGYIVGGGHSATDWVDDETSYSHNEIAINWQAALVYNLAWLVNE